MRQPFSRFPKEALPRLRPLAYDIPATHMRTCSKFTFGVGDRFAHGAHAQLSAFIEAEKLGIHITPVWNKSNCEHNIIGSEPAQTSVRRRPHQPFHCATTTSPRSHMQ
jgi:hypothetical protein